MLAQGRAVWSGVTQAVLPLRSEGRSEGAVRGMVRTAYCNMWWTGRYLQ